MDFFINPYDIFVANKMINGKKYTIMGYSNYKKLFHIDPNVVTEILEEINKQFGELVVSRGDKHGILGIQIKLRKDKIVELSKNKQLEESIEMFESTYGYSVKTPGLPDL